jgi:hypothetical protein
MPQLDIDLLEDFLFFAFTALFLGFGDEETEENVIETGAEMHLAHYYLTTRAALLQETSLMSQEFSDK